MDTLFLYRFGLAYQNVHRMLQDRGHAIDPRIFTKTPFEVSAELYQRALQRQCSLGETVACTFAGSPSTYLWCLDRNYDFLRSKERMISTDQVKALLDVAIGPGTHIVMCPNKLSPQAKKEMPSSFEVFLFDDLLIDLPRHELVLPHIPITETTLKQWLGPTMSKYDLPILPRSDPVARWFSFPVDTIVYIKHPINPSFRIVKAS